MRKLLCLALVAVAFTPAPAQQLASDYQQLLRPTLTGQAEVEHAAVNAGPLRLVFQEGKMSLAAPVRGRQMVVVFSGRGTLVVDPPNPVEQQQMKYLGGDSEGIAVPFTQAIFRFGDGAGWLAKLGVHFQPKPAQPSMTAIADHRADTIERQGLRFAARALLARDMAPGPWLFADLKTVRYGWLEARLDPLDGEAVEVHRYVESTSFNDAVVDDVWTHFAIEATPVARPWRLPPPAAPFRLGAYNLRITVPGNLDMGAEASFTVRSAVATRGLLLRLDSTLRVTQATVQASGGGPGQPVEFLQPRDPGRSTIPLYRGDWVYLRLPQPLAAGATARLTLQYHGKNEIRQVGDGNFFVPSEGWYPTAIWAPPMPRANYQLSVQVSSRYEVVATGIQGATHTQHGVSVTDWRTRQPITAAGFAFGDYKKFAKDIRLPGGQTVALRLLIDKQPDNSLAEINMLVQQYAPGLPIGTLDPLANAPQALSDIGGAMELMTAFYGPFPYRTLTVTGIPGNDGQSWPGLLYLSSLSFLDTAQLDMLGLPPAALNQLTDRFRAHEVSHQWWGQQVGWATYHDQWLSEGFANASSLLFQEAADGRSAAVATLQRWKRAIEGKNNLGHVVDQDGPLWLGRRLASAQDPDGYRILTYDKGGYVLWMLREMMLDNSAKNPDIHFIHMMRDYTKTYANRSPTTEDFEQIVDKHMRPAMDVTGDHTMRWFFDEYVYGTGIARLGFTSKIAPQGKGALLTMTVTDPGGWRGLLPVYIWQGNKVLRGQLVVRGKSSVTRIPLGFRPTKVVANQYDDMLVDVSQ